MGRSSEEWPGLKIGTHSIHMALQTVQVVCPRPEEHCKTLAGRQREGSPKWNVKAGGDSEAAESQEPNHQGVLRMGTRTAVLRTVMKFMKLIADECPLALVTC